MKIKRLIALLLTATLISGFLVPFSAITELDPSDKEVEIIKTDSEIVIDGKKDSAYNKANMIDVVEQNVDAWDESPCNTSAQVWTLWDDEFIYVYGELKDSDIYTNHGNETASIWNGDHMEIFVDFDYNRTTEYVYDYSGNGDNIAYLNIAPDGGDNFFHGYHLLMDGNEELVYHDLVQTSAVVDSAAGMVYYEARIPLPVDSCTITDGMNVGFEVGFSNATTEAQNRVGYVSWSPFGSRIYKWTHVAGTGILYKACSKGHEGPFNYDDELVCEACGETLEIPEAKNLGIVPYVVDAPDLDGVKDDIYADALNIPIDSIMRGEDRGLTAESSILFSDDYLYVFVEVNDPNIVIPDENHSKNPWDYDNVELFIDYSGKSFSDATGSADDYLSDAVQYRVDVSGYQSSYGFDENSDSWSAYGIDKNAPGAEPDDKGRYAGDFFEAETTVDVKSGVYTIEYKIPLTNTILEWGEDSIEYGDTFGINFQVTDFVSGTSETSGYTLKDFNGSWSWDAHLWPKLTLGQGCHILEKHDAKEASYVSAGNELYYECVLCGKLFEDAEAKVETTIDDVTIPQIKIVSVSGVTLDASSMKIEVGDSEKLVATVSPDNATNKNIIWSSDNEDVAVVSNGTVNAVGIGTATITATTEDGSYSAKCAIMVVCNHDLVHKTCADSTCTTKGVITSEGEKEYYACSVCGVNYNNADKDKFVTLVEEPIDPSNHDIEVHEAIEATYVSAGNELYYECVLCGKLFEDAEAKVETDRTKVIIPQKIQVSETGNVEISEDEVDEVIVKDKATNTVTIPLDNTVDHETGEVVSVSTVTLPVDVISEAEKTEASIELKTSDSSIKLDSAAIATISEAVNASAESTVELEVQIKTVEDALEDSQISAVEAHNVDEVAAVVSASILVDGKPVGSESEGGFNGGSATISIPFVPAEGSGSDYSILYVPDDGEAVLVDAKYDNTTKCLVFTTEHLSEYAIVKIHKCAFTELKLNDTYHWYVCSCGEHSEYVKHDYVSKFDENNHWKECSGCGDFIEKESHNPGAAATETTAQTCTDCGYIINNISGHTCASHLTKVDAEKVTCTEDGSSAYYECECGRWYKDSSATVEIYNKDSVVIPATGHIDEDNDKVCDICELVTHKCSYNIQNDEYHHWYECSCGDIINVQDHIESGWIVDVEASAFESGSKHKECKVCGYILQAESIENLGWIDENMFVFSNIIANKNFKITATYGEGGMISNAGETVVKYGDTMKYVITPFEGYKVKCVYINGKPIGSLDSYKFNYIRSSATIHVEFFEVQ